MLKRGGPWTVYDHKILIFWQISDLASVYYAYYSYAEYVNAVEVPRFLSM